MALNYKGITVQICKDSVNFLIFILMIIFSVYIKCVNYYFLWEVQNNTSVLPQAEHRGSSPEHRILKLLGIRKQWHPYL